MSDSIAAVIAVPSTPQVKPVAAHPGATTAGVEFEQMFLAEMLKHAGLGKTSQFGGGIGEDQFQSFLVAEQARIMAEAGGIGIAAFVSGTLEVKDGQ